MLWLDKDAELHVVMQQQKGQYSMHVFDLYLERIRMLYLRFAVIMKNYVFQHQESKG